MTLPHDITNLQSKMSAAVREHWKAFLFEGILLVILGLAAMIVPRAASLAVTIFLGWLFLISGIAGLALTFWARAGLRLAAIPPTGGNSCSRCSIFPPPAWRPSSPAIAAGLRHGQSYSAPPRSYRRVK